MTDFLWPAQLVPSASNVEVLDNAGRHTGPFSRRTRTIGRPGTGTRLSMSFRSLNLEKRALYTAVLSALGGMGRVWCHDHSHEARTGITAFPELVPSTTFANGLTGYTISGPGNWSGAVTDRVLRCTRNQNTGIAVGMVRVTDAMTVTPFAPYVGRALVMPGRGPSNALRLNFGSSAVASDYGSLQGALAGMLTHAIVPPASPVHFSIGQGITTSVAGDYLQVPYISFARCALVDNAPNIIPWSSNLANAAWNQNTGITVAATSVTLPDGSTGTAHTLHETSDSGGHNLGDNITVESTAGTWCIAAALKAEGRTWAQVRIQDVTAGNFCVANINLATGELGTVASSGGAWVEERAVSASLGNGWWYLALNARNTTSNTNLGARVFIGESNNDTSFDGEDKDSIYCWRPTLAKSSVPIRLSSTAGTAVSTGTLQALGGGIHTKGWPASTAGIRKVGDVIGLNGQLLKLTAPINSDAAGIAFVEFGGHLYQAPADNDPLILTQPMGRFMLESPENGWSNMPGIFSDAEIVLIDSPP